MFTHPELELMIGQLNKGIHLNLAMLNSKVYEGAEATLAQSQNEIMNRVIVKLADMRLNTVSIDADQLGEMYVFLKEYSTELKERWECDTPTIGYIEYIDKVLKVNELMGKISQGLISEEDLSAIQELIAEQSKEEL